MPGSFPVKRQCKDCDGGARPAPHPGPRCATHHREAKKASRRLAHGRWILKTYGITSEQYEALYEAQGGSCYICRRASGKTKRLAVDHDHRSGFVRGLLCSTCNKFLGHLRDDHWAGRRVGTYLFRPPAFRVIGEVKPDAPAT